MSERLFTPAEVNGLIPALSALMERAMDRHRQATALQRHLHEEQARIRASGGGLIDRRDWKARAERLDGLLHADRHRQHHLLCPRDGGETQDEERE